MSRLAPLITRLSERSAPIRALAVPRPFSGLELLRETAPAWSQDLKLFATVWLGGFVFFATLIA